MKRYVVGLFVVLLGCRAGWGQATSTASRRFDFQAGGALSLGKSDYDQQHWFRGGSLYTTLDFTHHFGAEFDFHQVKSPVDSTYERTYEIGGRYHRVYGSFSPYLKAMYGRGVFNFVADQYDAEGNVTGSIQLANFAYNEFAGGAGTDYRLLPYLNLRADYEYQTWRGFLGRGLNPQVLTFGVAYHFPGGLAKGNRFK